MGVEGRRVAVPLAVDGGISTPSNRIHLPLRKVIVHDVYIPPSTPRHPLHKLLPKMIERNSHLEINLRTNKQIKRKKKHCD